MKESGVLHGVYERAIERKRILFCETHTRGFSGAAQSLFNLLLGLDKSRFEIYLVSPKESQLTKHASKAGISVKIWPSRTSGPGFLQILNSWRQTPSLIRYFKRESIQLVHCNRLQSVLMFGWAAKLSGLPIIWHLRRGRSISFSEVLGFFFSDRIICVSETLSQQLLRSAWLRCKSKAITLHNGIDLSKFIPGRRVPPLRAELGLNEKDIVITSIGALIPRKCPELFIEVAKNLSDSFPDCRFLIVGDAPEDKIEFKNSLIEKAQELVKKGICIFTGFRNDVHNILAETDIFLLTSCSEGLPRVVLEAAASGCPVVSTEVEGIHELIINNRSGYIVPQQDLKGLISHVSSLIENPRQRHLMGRAGRNYIEQKFISKNIARKYERIVMDCL